MAEQDLEAISESAQVLFGPNFVIGDSYRMKGIQYKKYNATADELKKGLIEIGKKVGAEIITGLRYEFAENERVAYGTAIIPKQHAKSYKNI